MTREEAIAIIRREYSCVDRDCDIERSCGKCDLVMPSKEPILRAYEMAIKALEHESCEDCISRKAVIDIVEREQFKGDALSEIEKLQSVQPKPKTGYWVENEKQTHVEKMYHCSECGFEAWGKGECTDYCGGCGVRMCEVSE